MRVGFHVSISGSLDQAVDRAKESNCNTFQMFTRNPRGWKFKELDPMEVKSFKDKLRETAIGPPVAHMPYLPNLSCPENEIYKKSVDTLLSEVDRCVELEIPYVVTHLGSHLGVGREVGLKRITDALKLAVKRGKGNIQILLENMAGTKNSMGSTFEEVKEIFEGVRKEGRLGVCFDTCLPEGSTIFSEHLPRPVEYLAPSDTVLGSDGSFDRIVRVWKRPYSGKLISIKPEGLPWVHATPEHPILCLKSNGWRQLESKPWRTRLVSAPTWIYARDIKPGHFVVMPKLLEQDRGIVDFRPYIGAATRRFFFPTRMRLTNSFAELLGLFLAEGFTFMGHGERGGENGKVFFAFGHREKHLIERTRNLVDELFSLKAWVDDTSTAVKVCIGSNILTRFFRDNFGSGATKKRIPPVVLQAPPEQVKAFLRGYLLGDGCADRRGLRYTTTSKTVAYQLIHLLAKVDVRGTLYRHGPTSGSIQGRVLKSSGWFVVHVAAHEANRLGFVYKFPSATPRRIIRDNGHFYMPVKEIRVEPYEGAVYNLTTESGTFTAPFIVTHNCHAYAAGFDLHTEKSVEQTLSKFDDILGFENLRIVHLNDSKGGLGSGLDRHEHIGMGYIGAKGFRAVLHHRAVRDLPLILETPIDERRDDQGNLQMVRRLGK